MLTRILISLLSVALCMSLDVIELNVTIPSSNSTGVAYTSFASTTIQKSESEIVINNIIDKRIEELRSAGQLAPCGLLFAQVEIGNPSLDANTTDEKRFLQFHALFDTGSDFNILPRNAFRKLSLLLGSPCRLEWGDSSVEEGQFTVATVKFNGEEKDVIFCVLPKVQDIIVNRSFLQLWDLCICSKSVQRCSNVCQN
jgi:predicted aspartyl protease